MSNQDKLVQIIEPRPEQPIMEEIYYEAQTV